MSSETGRLCIKTHSLLHCNCILVLMTWALFSLFKATEHVLFEVKKNCNFLFLNTSQQSMWSSSACSSSLSLTELRVVVFGSIHLQPRQFAIRKWFDGVCNHVLVYSTGILRNELICGYTNVVHTSSSFYPHTYAHSHII